MIPGAGWISLGPGYRRWYDQDRAFLDTAASLSWHGYRVAQARFEMPRLARRRLTLGAEVRWQDFMQVDFFGEGPDSFETAVSEYRLRSGDVVGYASVRPSRQVAVDLSVGWLQPDVLPPGGFFKSGRPDARDAFPENVVFGLADQPPFVHAEAAVRMDTRDFEGHPTRGGLLRGAIANYSDRDSGLFTFRRYELEGAQFVPLAQSRIVLALHGWLVASDPGEGHLVPFYLQPTLGGHDSLRSYENYRFMDRNALLVNAEARIAMMTHLDAAVFVDAGNVARQVGDLDLDKRSYGVGLRLHSRQDTFARVDMATGDEGWRFLFRLTEPFTLSRLTRRAANIPFVP
jgi:hypothetical protein